MMKFGLFLLLIFEVNCFKHKMTKTKLFHGKEDSIEKVPYYVQLYDPIVEKTVCGGSIISERWILTAAHCLRGDHYFSARYLKIISGTNKKYNKDSDLSYHEVESFIIHENFGNVRLDGDIALIKLKEPLLFDDKQKPIKVRSTPLKKELLKTSGMGAKDKWSYSENLESIYIPVVDTTECKEMYFNEYKKYLYLPDGVFCAGTKNEFSCHGDSGGPVVDLQGELVGLTVGGDPMVVCAQGAMPSIFTSVTYYLDWIEDHTDIDFNSSIENNYT